MMMKLIRINMDYRKIIIDAYRERKTTTYLSYFKREAKKAQKDYVEIEDFINGCKIIVNGYKAVIKREYEQRLHENDLVLESIYSGNGVKYDGEVVTDLNDERIKETIKQITDDKKAIEEGGYTKDEEFYPCRLDKNGDITNDCMKQAYRLNYPELALIETGLLQAEAELATSQIPQSEVSEQPKSNANEVNTSKPQRTINAEKLKGYFNATFKGMGNNNINYFDWLINDLQTDRSGKEFAQIALMIYESGKLNNTKPASFTAWYKIFCECIGCERKGYTKNKLRNPNKNLKSTFSYL
jgi:hypothetical protein